MRRFAAGLPVLVALWGLSPPARADLVNFDLNGKTYTKFMYQNDDTQGCLSLSNPFWVDNFGGHNGACTEFELNIKGQIGPRVSAGVRLQSRWGALWQDWWENGDLHSTGIDTSGESMGMNHAAYMKLRSVFVRFAPPVPTVKWVTVGSTDMGTWNEWTIGKARYIDRDNAGAIVLEGDLLDQRKLSYAFGATALPKLWGGPGWNTGIAYNDPLAKLYGTDWAWSAKLESRPRSDLRVRAIGAYVQDWEADRYDPDRTGDADVDRQADHGVDLVSRFSGVNATLDFNFAPDAFEFLTVSGLAAFSRNNPNPEYATNLVRNGQGFSPVLFKQDADGNPLASLGAAGKLLVEVQDPLGIGLSGKFEYFNLGTEFNAILGSRREADVLLTEGIITSGFIRGGQLPTLNVANEFVDWDEPWYETVIGWHGGTGLLEYVKGKVKGTLEYTAVGYNTNMQDRDTKNQYPDFLYTHGFTDPQAYTADSDYANVFDRGKDPRSVYAQYQNRFTQIVVANGEFLVPGLKGFVFNVKGKHVRDGDTRKADNPKDDYRGAMWLGYGQASWAATNELKLALGYEYQLWDERARTGTQAGGFFDYLTKKHTGRLGLSYMFGGIVASWTMEYFHKDLVRNMPGSFNQTWNVWRSKATFEVGW